MALTKKMNVFHLTTCPCQIGNIRHLDKGMIIPGTLTRMTPGRSTMNMIKAGTMNTTAERAANIRIILMSTGIVQEITEMPDIVVGTTQETIGRITGKLGTILDITPPAGRTPLTICTDHTLNTDIKLNKMVLRATQ